MAAQAIYLKKDFKQVIISSNLKASQKAVMYYLIDLANPHRGWTCFPSHARIAQACGRSISTIKRAIAELVRRGFLSKLAQFRRAGGFQSSNLYTLFIPDGTNENEERSGELPQGSQHGGEMPGQLELDFEDAGLEKDGPDVKAGIKKALAFGYLSRIVKEKKKKKRPFYSVFIK
ncbi:MAG: helix-turn-helix domain-containing protein [Lachnospiraceae bacterium]|nr:helix-turn-helix domain-containing protein [Lachnospiraceae bacterium]